jgi:hypothetical protein
MREGSATKVSTSSTNWNANTNNLPNSRKERERSELFKTQAYPRKVGDELFKTMLRPSSVRRK